MPCRCSRVGNGISDVDCEVKISWINNNDISDRYGDGAMQSQEGENGDVQSEGEKPVVGGLYSVRKEEWGL